MTISQDILYHNIIKYYQKGIYPPTKKIVCIGDIHGDYYAFIKCLKKGNIIDNNLNYIGGNTHVVQIGDILDRKSRDINGNDEDSELKIISLIIKLQKEAFINKGGFHCVIGNHEFMNINGDFSYVSDAGFNSFDNNIYNRLEYFKPGNTFAKYLADTWNPIVIIGSNLFVHGGLSYNIAKLYDPLTINFIMRKYLKGNLSLKNTSFFNKIFTDEKGILWNRDYYFNNNEIELRKTLNTYKCKRMIVGHTPQLNGILSKFNRKIWFIDTGMSEAFGTKYNKNDRIKILIILNNGNNIIIK